MAATHGEGASGNGVGVTTPLEHKLAQAGGIVKTATGAIRPGLFWGGTATIVTGTAGMAYAVAAFTCASTRGLTAGAMLWANDGTLNVSTTAAPGSNSRIDIIYAWHREWQLDGVNSDPVIGVVQGTAAAIPTVPSLAAFPGAIELARATVSAGATATNGGSVVITQTAPFTASSGGVVVTRNAAERNAGSWADGQQVRILDKGWIGQKFGSDWEAVGGAVPYADAPIQAATGLSANTWITLALAAPVANDIVQSSSRLTVAVKGRYDGAIAGTFTSAGDARMRFVINGVATSWEVGGAVASGVGRVNVSAHLYLNAGDYVEVQMLTSQASAQLFGGRVALSYAGPLV